ncbi:hypothetical protein TVAG_107070 [Trichomonas vaginalis G3]|uniref:C3H1-type domain-containing protein n=1 Tax=Trichomonas vaginalis (strain ATCC PRA-98 / G3) TaxID=412133 RepID=A2FE48_TRIV3|nr:U6 snRNA binding [Trichomonas vaginalis G3]EAX96820.1 hypothetical protein TVAG_107070 [Trichomonas vaginalis G3]KAI5536683.1 U6 snRNA binding [Trichomonas vaginalis G3]|eukprot:XP_001309750.1 hypothetical protein [Trichomonas vaginalis G3]
MSGEKDSLLELLDPPFPLVYKGILPPDNHFQMKKSRLSRECAVCERVFSVFFWMYNGVPYKTYICQICAKAANVCQCSLLDLDIGIPVIVRNKLLKMQQGDFTSKYKRWYNNRLVDRQIENGEEWMDGSLRDKVLHLDPTIVAECQQIVKQDPYLTYKKATVCPDWLAGNCIYGESCFFSHKLPLPGESSPNCSKYGIRSRYLGTLDPNGSIVIDKLLNINPNAFKSKQQAPEPEEVELPKFEEKRVEKPIMTLPSNLGEAYSYSEPLPYPSKEKYEFPDFVNGVFKLPDQ